MNCKAFEMGSKKLIISHLVFSECIVNLVDGVIWDHEAAGSNPVTPTVAVADLVMHQIVALEYVGANPIGHTKRTHHP